MSDAWASSNQRHPRGQAERLSLPAALLREAYVTAGYTPFLSFEVKELQDSVQTLLSLGATLDGAIRYMDEGQVGMHIRVSEQESNAACHLVVHGNVSQSQMFHTPPLNTGGGPAWAGWPYDVASAAKPWGSNDTVVDTLQGMAA